MTDQKRADTIAQMMTHLLQSSKMTLSRSHAHRREDSAEVNWTSAAGGPLRQSACGKQSMSATC